MRTEKFNSNKSGYENDDLKYAFGNDGLSEILGNVDVIIAEVCGENDGYNWYWILQMRDGTFGWAEGGCDYTGWDCQSHASFNGNFKTPFEALENVKTEDYDSRKSIKICLEKQLKEELPFAIYQE